MLSLTKAESLIKANQYQLLGVCVIILMRWTSMKQDIEMLTNGIIDKFNPNKIILFGSHARQEVTENSDIDICIIADIGEENVRSLRKNIRGYILKREGLNYLDRPVDIVLYTPQQFEQISKKVGTMASVIAKEGVVLHG